MMFDHSVLREKIRTTFTTDRAFAESLGIAPSTLSHKLNSRREFTMTEMEKSIKLLNLQASDFQDCFYTLK